MYCSWSSQVQSISKFRCIQKIELQLMALFAARDGKPNLWPSVFWKTQLILFWEKKKKSSLCHMAKCLRQGESGIASSPPFAQSLSCVWLFVTLWTVACQAPLSLEFSRQENCSRLPFPPSGALLDPSPSGDRTWVSCISCIGRQILLPLSYLGSP